MCFVTLLCLNCVLNEKNQRSCDSSAFRECCCFLLKEGTVQLVEKKNEKVAYIHVPLCCEGQWPALSSPAAAAAAAAGVPPRRRPMKLPHQLGVRRRRSPPVLPGSQATSIHSVAPGTRGIDTWNLRRVLVLVKWHIAIERWRASGDLTWPNGGCTAAAPCTPNPLNKEWSPPWARARKSMPTK